MEKFLEFVKKYKRYVIAGCIVLLIVSYYFYQRSFGYFAPMSLKGILPEGRNITGLYKTGDFYTLIDDFNEIYAINIDKNFKVSLIEKNINKKAGFPIIRTPLTKNMDISFAKTNYIVTKAQLDNGNIAFVYIDISGRLTIYIYNPISKKIINQYKSNIIRDESSSGPTILVLNKGDFLLSSLTKNGNGVKRYVERYDYSKNSLNLISNESVYFVHEVLKYSDGKYLIQMGYDEESRHGIIFEPENNKFTRVSTDFIKNEVDQDINNYRIKCDKLKYLKQDTFLVSCSQDSSEGEYIAQFSYDPKTKEFKYLPKKTTYIKMFAPLKPIIFYGLSEDWIWLSENEYLFLSGADCFLIACKPSKRAYIYNAEKKKIKKIKNLIVPYYSRYQIPVLCEGKLKIDSNHIIFFVDNKLQVFKRSRVW